MLKKTALGSAITLASLVISGSASAQNNFRFTTFSVPGAVSLQVEQINDEGTIAGIKTISQGANQGYVRYPNGKIITLVNPGDAGGLTKGSTNSTGINDLGAVAGYYFNTAAGNNQGFFYYFGTWINYVLPAELNAPSTFIIGLNNLGDFTGEYFNGSVFAGFVNHDGNVQSIVYPGSIFNEGTSLNDFGYIVGVYQTSNTGPYHGFLRSPNGNLTTIDAPAANTAANQGTVLLGINDFGWISGHFWDSSGNEHGFVGIPKGTSFKFIQIDVPGAASTSGGALNNLGQVPGHWIDKNGNQLGYIATFTGN